MITITVMGAERLKALIAEENEEKIQPDIDRDIDGTDQCETLCSSLFPKLCKWDGRQCIGADDDREPDHIFRMAGEFDRIG